MNTMLIEQSLRAQWKDLRARLTAKRLLVGSAPSLSLRLPGSDAMWFGKASDLEPQRLSLQELPRPGHGGGTHAATYALRDDVCAVACGGGDFGLRLVDFDGAMPGVFDEQVRHLGKMMPPTRETSELARALRPGGNVLLFKGEPVVLGMTGARLVLNAELFEKCAKAYVLAQACGGATRALPWIVRFVANRRLMKDEKLASARTKAGLLPEETKGY